MSRTAGVALILCLVICTLAGFRLSKQAFPESLGRLTGKELGIMLACSVVLLLPLLL